MNLRYTKNLGQNLRKNLARTYAKLKLNLGRLYRWARKMWNL